MDRVTEGEDQPTQQRHETPPQDGGPTQEVSPPQSHETWQEVQAAEELATPMTTGSWELPATRETTLSGPGEAQGHEVDGGKEAGEDETSGPSVKTQAGEEEDKTEVKPSVKTQEDKTEDKTEAKPSVKMPQEAMMETETEMDQTHSSQHGTQGHEAGQRSGGTEQPKTGTTSATDPATTKAQGLVASSCGHRTRTVTGGDGTGPKTRDGGHDGVTCQPSGDDRPKSRSVTPPKTPPPEGHKNLGALLGKTSSQPLSDAEIAALGGRRNRAVSRPPAPRAEPKAAEPKAQPKAAEPKAQPEAAGVTVAKAKPKSRPRVTEEESRSPAAWESVTSEMMTDLGYSQAAQDAMRRLSVTSHGRVNACLILCLAKLP